VDLIVVIRGDNTEVLEEGKWVKASFDNEIRIDQNTHLRSGDQHAHIYDRKGNELYVVTQDGRPSHGSQPFELSTDQADALKRRGFNVPKNRIVEAEAGGKLSWRNDSRNHRRSS
jgi:hypothetical protein